jgi:alpha-mannosidase
MKIPNLIAGTLCLAALTAIARAEDAAWRPVKRSLPEASTVRPRTVYILPHSHTDIGYTTHQVDIYEKQINNLLQGIAEAKRTADYPEGARFVWNVEVAWAADLMLQRLPKTLQDEFFNAVKRGQISINGMYLNNLTGLSRPEELIRLFRYSTQLAEKTGVPIDSAMISDVPGYTWGTVPAMNQAGIRYFSVAPNSFDRIGDILFQWEDKPFWWIGPDGESKVLVWIPFLGYSTSHVWGKLDDKRTRELCDALEKKDYPYDIAYLRWAGHGDNAIPDPSLCDFVRTWNEAYASPRLVIASTHDAFSAFEERHGNELPRVKGEWSPYWEDGAGSSAAETALNRASSERLTQAQALWAMTAPMDYPAKRFEEAWNQVLLYSEHTWGAYCSVRKPNIPFTADQWTVKQSYATSANLLSRQLLLDAAQVTSELNPVQASNPVDVYNTTAFTRSEVTVLCEEVARGISTLADEKSQEAVPVQRLTTGDLAVWVEGLPPFSGRRYVASTKPASRAAEAVRVTPTTLENDRLFVRLDATTGSIGELRLKGLEQNFVDASGGHALNDYLYFNGADASKAVRSGPATITIHEQGPLVASLRVTSDAPGCHTLSREIRLSCGSDCVEIFNLVDKQRLIAKSYIAPEGKESLNFAFAFHVPDGEIKMDVPFGVFRPETEQIPSACKNWLTVGTWADIANKDFGVTWITLDAPLVQVGHLSANLLNSQTDHTVWRKKIEPTQKLFSWAMNNHWSTNYRAYQDQPTLFRYAIRPYQGAQSNADSTLAATRHAQPLLALLGRGAAPSGKSLLTVNSPSVTVTGLKPADDGGGLILRLFNTSEKPAEASLSEPDLKFYLSSTHEQAGKRIENNHLTFKPFELMTIRGE